MDKHLNKFRLQNLPFSDFSNYNIHKHICID